MTDHEKTTGEAARGGQDDPTLCDCPCHGGRAVHPVPCSCRVCQFCMRPVKSGVMNDHLTHCKSVAKA